jgi:phosphoribosylformylglycinamidine synthase
LAAYSVPGGGIAEAISKMCFGNGIGFVFEPRVEPGALFRPDYGDIMLELPGDLDLAASFGQVSYELLGLTSDQPAITLQNVTIALDEAVQVWTAPLEKVFPTRA